MSQNGSTSSDSPAPPSSPTPAQRELEILEIAVTWFNMSPEEREPSDEPASAMLQYNIEDLNNTRYCCFAPGCASYHDFAREVEHHAQFRHAAIYPTLCTEGGQFDHSRIVIRTSRDAEMWARSGGNLDDREILDWMEIPEPESGDSVGSAPTVTIASDNTNTSTVTAPAAGQATAPTHIAQTDDDMEDDADDDKSINQSRRNESRD